MTFDEQMEMNEIAIKKLLREIHEMNELFMSPLWIPKRDGLEWMPTDGKVH